MHNNTVHDSDDSRNTKRQYNILHKGSMVLQVRKTKSTQIKKKSNHEMSLSMTKNIQINDVVFRLD